MNENIKTIENLIDTYGDYLKKTAYFYTNDFNIAEDLVQETFISLYKNWDCFKKQSRYKTYLYRILINHCKMHLRKNPAPPIPLELNLKSDDLFEQHLVDNLSLTDAVMQLDSKHRQIVILHYLNDLSINEISDVLNIGQSAVKMRLKRARKKLESSLRKDDSYAKF